MDKNSREQVEQLIDIRKTEDAEKCGMFDRLAGMPDRGMDVIDGGNQYWQNLVVEKLKDEPFIKKIFYYMNQVVVGTLLKPKCYDDALIAVMIPELIRRLEQEIGGVNVHIHDAGGDSSALKVLGLSVEQVRGLMAEWDEQSSMLIDTGSEEDIVPFGDYLKRLGHTVKYFRWDILE